MSVIGLQPVIFGWDVNAPSLKDHKQQTNDNNNKSDDGYNHIFLQRFDELKRLYERSQEDSFQKAWKKTLTNFSKFDFPSNYYEEQIYEIFHKNVIDEFTWRSARLAEQYKKLEGIYDSALTSKDIISLTQLIFTRQQQLCECYLKLTEIQQKSVSLEKFYRKTTSCILDKDQRNLLVAKIVECWNISKTNLLFLTIRTQFNALSSYSQEELNNFSLDQIVENIQQIAKEIAKTCTYPEPINGSNNKKKLYEILSMVHFNESQEQRVFDAMKSLPDFSPVDFKYFVFKRDCQKLKAILSSQIGNADELLKQIATTVRFLGESYSSGALKRADWDHIYDYVEALPISIDIKKPLLKIFLNYKKPKITQGYIDYAKTKIKVSADWLYSWYDNTIADGESRWKGDKYFIMLQDTQNWFKANEERLRDQLDKDKISSKKFKLMVESILKILKEMDLPQLHGMNPNLDERRTYNNKLREINQNYLSSLRTVLKSEECIAAFALHKMGKERAGGAAHILLELCHQRFTGINLNPFIVNLMKEMINIGLDQLIKRDTFYKFFRNREIFTNPLDIGTEMIHKAIKYVPAENISPFFATLWWKVKNVVNDWDLHLQGASPLNIYKMTFKMSDSSSQDVTVLRFPSPTNPADKINPEFKGFLQGKRTCFVSFQGSHKKTPPEGQRSLDLFHLNSNETFVSIFPVSGSDLFHQKGKHADINNQSAYPTAVSFESAIMDHIIPDSQSDNRINQAGNYIFPPAWTASGEFKEMIDKCLKQTHQIFFNGEQSLPEDDRRAFIKLFNVVLAFELIKFTKAEYFSFLCNHGADRTGVFFTLMLKILLIAFEKENVPIDSNRSETWNQLLEAFVDGVPLVVAKREMNGFHEGLIEALEVLKQTNVQKRIIENREKMFGLVGFEYSFASKNKNNNNEQME